MALRLSTGLRNALNGINTTLVTNGTFASDTTGWTQVTGTLAYDSGTGGGSTTGFAKITADGSAGVFRNTTAITVKGNQLYCLSFYFKQAPSNGTTGFVEIGTTAGGAEVAQTRVLSDTDWTKHDFWFRTSVAQTSIYLTFNTSVATSGYGCYFDEVTLSHSAGSIQENFYKGFIKIYTGAQPSSANDAPTGTLLVTIYSDGSSTGLTFSDSSNGVMSKSATETWSGTAVSSGTAGWFRLVAPSDSGASSTTDRRIDGSVATSGAQLNMSSTTIVSGAVQTISTFQITIPAE